MSESAFIVRRVLHALPQYGYRFASEVELHQGIAAALDAHGVPYEREVRASSADRFDFLCAAGVVIEAKIKGSLPEALIQVDRYCQLPQVTVVVIASTKKWAAGQRSAELHGKPVHILRLPPQAF